MPSSSKLPLATITIECIHTSSLMSSTKQKLTCIRMQVASNTRTTSKIDHSGDVYCSIPNRKQLRVCKRGRKNSFPRPFGSFPGSRFNDPTTGMQSDAPLGPDDNALVGYLNIRLPHVHTSFVSFACTNCLI